MNKEHLAEAEDVTTGTTAEHRVYSTPGDKTPRINAPTAERLLN
jgi:hypothetical protein